ncbi:hypothetical protein EKD04_005920 [Chloroflexales bacterium ZM16-3]|nr:hypothetical protein [Chloroflexales bacterium ZM16-3]
MADDNDQVKAVEDEENEPHEPPRGTLLIMIGYLLVTITLWMQAYLTLLHNGGLPPL